MSDAALPRRRRWNQSGLIPEAVRPSCRAAFLRPHLALYFPNAGFDTAVMGHSGKVHADGGVAAATGHLEQAISFGVSIFRR
jgi:hypothetical protein